MVHLTDTRHACGTVVVAAAIQPRYYNFTMSLDNLGAPVGTKLNIVRSCDITQNFNSGIKAMVGDWVWFLGDDHSFEPTLLMRLLDFDVDVVVPITPCKVPPWSPCIMHGPADTSTGFWQEDMVLYHWDELSGDGLLPLPKGDFIGQAGMLVRKPVLDKIGYPWFKCGQLDPGRLQEDMMFCHEVQELGYTVNIDQGTIFDHHFPVTITARRHAGKWCPALKSGNDSVVVLPDAKPVYTHTVNGNKYYGVPRSITQLGEI